MPTKYPRIHVSFKNEETVALLNRMAEHDHQSVSSLAEELILEALDRREDVFLSAIAKTRDVPTAKRVKQDDIWE